MGLILAFFIALLDFPFPYFRKMHCYNVSDSMWPLSAYKSLTRMNMPLDQEGKVQFTTTLFALIRENLSIKMRSAEEMDQADMELRETILKVMLGWCC